MMTVAIDGMRLIAIIIACQAGVVVVVLEQVTHHVFRVVFRIMNRQRTINEFRQFSRHSV